MPSSSYEDYTTIKQNTEVYGFNFITGSEVGKNCTLKPFNQIYNSKIYNNATIDASKLINSTVMSNASIGPNAHLRPNSVIGKNAKIGNFVEVKNVKMGKNSKASHLTYLGDGIIGEGCNIGCGVIFCNYDGKQKHKTVLGNNVFVGSNVNLVAPIELGNNSLVAAGSTLTDDVPEGALAIARQKQTNKLNYNKRKK